MSNHEQEKRFSKNKIKSMEKTKLFFGTLPVMPWTTLALWLHIGAF
jgi:hypothetical protein